MNGELNAYKSVSYWKKTYGNSDK